MPMQKHKPGATPLALLVVIGEKEQRKKTLALLECQKAYFSMATHAKGTASSRTLNYLGLGETEKAVYLSVRTAQTAREILRELEDKMKLGRHGHGIAFMAEVTKGSYHRPVEIAREEKGGATMENTAAYELILAVVNQGYTDDVMEAARSAGANGGTVVHGRGCGLAGAERFFGVTIQPEKEVIIIAAPQADTSAIMDAIAQKTGPETEAGAISFALPLSDVRGISPSIPEEQK